MGSAIGIVNGFIREMKKKAWGRLITLTLVAVKQPAGKLILSNLVRASVVGLGKSLSNELGEYGIKVHEVMTAYTHTEPVRKLAAKNISFSNVVDSIPLKRSVNLTSLLLRFHSQQEN